MDTDRLPAGVYSPDDPWDFGTSNDLPALKADRNGDGIATWREFGGQRRGGRDHDRNDNNLIEVSNLAQLNSIRYDSAGVGTPSNAASRAFRSPAYNMGCATKCQGYELTADLYLDTNRNRRADSRDAYWNDGAGWEPIGNGPTERTLGNSTATATTSPACTSTAPETVWGCSAKSAARASCITWGCPTWI